ncbi:hypothetical protein niasHS_011256 [Heterodera schachtii]|uniref:arginine kinase n=1 Tax=Heterodera schachtii TaxID=97005 RepID=A0ABD2ITZ8_HETSC
MDVPQEVIDKIEAGYEKLRAEPDCDTLLKKYLIKDVLDACKDKRTKFGATFLDVIQPGVDNPTSGVGVYAPGGQFIATQSSPLFDPIIEASHDGFGPNSKQPATDFGERKTQLLMDLEPEVKFIESTCIRCGRSLKGYPFNPFLTKEMYVEIESKAKAVFEQLKSDAKLGGTYYPIEGMANDVQNQLIADHLLIKEGDLFLQQANAYCHWPTGRGIFHNAKKSFLVWVNEEDHIPIISMQNGGNVGQVLECLIKGVRAIESKVTFLRDDRLGWLTFCPSNLGTAVRASVLIRLSKISEDDNISKGLCGDLKLDARGIHGKHSESADGVYDISNKVRLGLTEFDAVKLMYDGVKKLIEWEKDPEHSPF